MMELTRERIGWVIVAAALLAGIFAYLFFFHPLLNKIRAKGSECRILEEELHVARNNVALLAKDRKEIPLVRREQVSLAIEELTRRGKNQGVSFISIAPRAVDSIGGTFSVLPIDLETESRYEALGAFLGVLDELETSLVKVRNFDLAPHPKDEAKIRANVTIDLYLSPEGSL